MRKKKLMLEDIKKINQNFGINRESIRQVFGVDFYYGINQQLNHHTTILKKDF